MSPYSTSRNRRLEAGGGVARERERQRDRETDRQTDRQRQRQRDREGGIRIRMIYSFRPLLLMKGCRWVT